MEIDIRTNTQEEINKIRFGDMDDDFIIYDPLDDQSIVKIAEGDSGSVYIKDIDNLILALQKAKELWS